MPASASVRARKSAASVNRGGTPEEDQRRLWMARQLSKPVSSRRQNGEFADSEKQRQPGAQHVDPSHSRVLGGNSDVHVKAVDLVIARYRAVLRSDLLIARLGREPPTFADVERRSRAGSEAVVLRRCGGKLRTVKPSSSLELGRLGCRRGGEFHLRGEELRHAQTKPIGRRHPSEDSGGRIHGRQECAVEKDELLLDSDRRSGLSTHHSTVCTTGRAVTTG